MTRSGNSLAVPGLQWGAYPERVDRHDHRAGIRSPGAAWRVSPRRRLARVRATAAAWQQLSAHAFEQQRCAVQAQVARQGLGREEGELCCALALEAARRALGKTAYDGQLLAALQMLDNRLVEMATGEGKSLAAALGAAMGALAGLPVHVVTANDYLVARDAEGFKPLFEALGLGVAAVLAGQVPALRRAAYAHDIVYVTAKELVFDYLRDRQSHGAGRSALQQRVGSLARPDADAPLLRGLCMAIIDEADSILIDEAQMPLILSRERHDRAAQAYLWQAWSLSGRLQEGEHFTLQRAERKVALTEPGRECIAALAQKMSAAWQSTRHREEGALAALKARHVMQRDRDYLVLQSDDPRVAAQAGGARLASGKPAAQIVIVDEVSGRIAEGRRWSGGLHALVAIKEGCPPEPELETLSQITFQRFFRRYHRLGGMSGTLREARAELAGLYGLRIVPVAPRLPSRRVTGPVRLFSDTASRWQAVAQRSAELAATGRPVLIGTDSVAASLSLSAVLAQAGLAHAVLNASFDAEESRIVAAAGRAGCITVSTNMAGRGTDIELDPAALAAGGLHVICCQHNASRRLDRQLAGRAARQGQPGSSEAWIVLDAPRFAHGAGRHAAVLMKWAGGATRLGSGAVLPAWRAAAAQTLFVALQGWDEARDARRRQEAFRQDCLQEQGLSFCGGAL